jgi:hypothetical protein
VGLQVRLGGAFVMQGTVSYAALGPRERSIIDAFAKGDVWSPAYYSAWLDNRPTLEREAIKFAFAGDDPDKVAEADTRKSISAAFIRNALLSKVMNEQGVPLTVDERGARLEGVIVEGKLDLTAIEFRKPIVFKKCTFDSTVILEDTKLGRVSFDGSTIPSLLADMAEIEGDLSLNGLKRCEWIRLVRARIRGTLILEGAILGRRSEESPMLRGGESSDGSNVPLNCNGAHVGGAVWLRHGFEAAGEVNFGGAIINEELDCEDGKFEGHYDKKLKCYRVALDCDAITVGASVFLRYGFSARGEVNFVRATIKGNFQCQGGSFDDGLTADAPDLERESPDSERESYDAMDLEGAYVGGTLYLTKVKTFEGILDLQDAYAKNVADDGTIRNDDPRGILRILKKRTKRLITIHLDRFCYDSFANDFGGKETDLSARARLSWLKMQPEEWCGTKFRPQPFTRCAKVLRSMGHTKDARLILYEREKRRLRHNNVSWFEWLIRKFLLGLFAGYGYKAHRAFGALVVVWLFGAGLFAIEGQYGLMRIASDNVLASDWYVAHNTQPPDYEPFKPWLYSLDVLLPIIDFNQKHSWTPDDAGDRVPGFERILPPTPDVNWAHWLRGCLAWLPKAYYWFEIAMGWFLTTVIIAGLTGLLGNPREE